MSLRLWGTKGEGGMCLWLTGQRSGFDVRLQSEQAAAAGKTQQHTLCSQQGPSVFSESRFNEAAVSDAALCTLKWESVVRLTGFCCYEAFMCVSAFFLKKRNSMKGWSQREASLEKCHQQNLCFPVLLLRDVFFWQFVGTHKSWDNFSFSA